MKSKLEIARDQYVRKEVAENDGSYWGWNTDDMALAGDAWDACAAWFMAQAQSKSFNAWTAHGDRCEGGRAISISALQSLSDPQSGEANE